MQILRIRPLLLPYYLATPQPSLANIRSFQLLYACTDVLIQIADTNSYQKCLHLETMRSHKHWSRTNDETDGTGWQRAFYAARRRLRLDKCALSFQRIVLIMLNFSYVQSSAANTGKKMAPDFKSTR